MRENNLLVSASAEGGLKKPAPKTPANKILSPFPMLCAFPLYEALIVSPKEHVRIDK
jgi:hypothetical protein